MTIKTKQFMALQFHRTKVSWLSGIVMVAIAVFGFAYFGRAQNTVQLVQCIQDLRALDVSSGSSAITNGQVVLVADYYTGGDLDRARGGGHFRWVTPASSIYSPADDGGRYIYPNTNSATPGVWERLLQGEVANVKMWGARGNGIADDFIPIQNALNAMNVGTGVSNGWSGELVFPKGTYMVTNTLITSFARIRGEYAANSIVMMRSNYFADIFRTPNADNAIKGLSVDFDHWFSMSDLKIEFQSTAYNSSNACLVICQPGEASSIHNIQTENGGFGIRCYGSGAPGLRLRDVTLSDASVAGVSVEPIPGQAGENGDCVSFIGVSGDMRSDAASPTASLIRFVNSAGGGEISQVKAEGDFGGGVIQFSYVPGGNADHGYLQIHNCGYNSGQTDGGYYYPTAFLRLLGTNQTVSVTLSMLNLFSCPVLIDDQPGNRIVDADTQNFSGDAQMVARTPICYESNNGTNFGRLVMGQTAFSYFYPTNGTGWYRVMQNIPSSHHISGKLVFNVPNLESVELQVDMDSYHAASNWSLTPTRCPYGGGVITQARGVLDPSGNMFVDIYVGNPFTHWYVPRAARMTIAHDLNGYEGLDSVPNQLIPVPYPVSATLPVGSSSNVVNTFR